MLDNPSIEGRHYFVVNGIAMAYPGNRKRAEVGNFKLHLTKITSLAIATNMFVRHLQ